MYVYIFIAIAFAVTASVIAYSKGRNSLGWFLAGLLIGPFALVVAALNPVVREGQYSRCVACGEIIREEASVCRYCGTTVERVREPYSDDGGHAVDAKAASVS